jgi:glycerophosphoryl diester phosphodiesterase
MADSNPPRSRLPIAHVIGHRGVAGHAPENTLAAIRMAAHLRCTWIELDVRPTAEGRPIVIHDETLDRTTNGHGAVEITPLEVIDDLQAGPGREPIPTLEEALSLAASLGLNVILEIKPPAGRAAPVGPAVLDIVKAVWPAHMQAPLLSSSDIGELCTLRDVAPTWPLALLGQAPIEGWLHTVSFLECCAIGLDVEGIVARTIQIVRATLGTDIRVLAFTVNDHGQAAQLFSWGVDAIFSDYPDWIVSALPQVG